MERQVVSDPGASKQITRYCKGVRVGGFVFVPAQPGADAESWDAAGRFAEQARQASPTWTPPLRASGEPTGHGPIAGSTGQRRTHKHRTRYVRRARHKRR